MASVYVHFPYCLAKCPYCDFVSYAAGGAEIDHDGYADAVILEAERRASSFDRVVGSIFFGGGTPSLWDPRALGRVLRRLHELYDVAPDVEVTAECNPTSLDRDRAAALRDAGVGRLSIGTQSLRAEQLAFLGRKHDPDGARAAIEAALAAGVARVSADLIFGLPRQTPEDAATQASELVGLGLRHLSAYQLTIEPGTQFGERKKRGLLPTADDATVAEAFLEIDEVLGERGLAHYEISNYAEPGEEARHNLAYWRGDEYVGLGCAAYGFAREGRGGIRWRNPIDPRRYVAFANDGAQDADVEPLTPETLLRERIMLGLRIAEGVDLGRARDDLGVDPWTPERVREVERLVARGRLARSGRDGEVLSVPRDAWLFTDDTAARLF